MVYLYFFRFFILLYDGIPPIVGHFPKNSLPGMKFNRYSFRPIVFLQYLCKHSRTNKKYKPK